MHTILHIITHNSYINNVQYTYKFPEVEGDGSGCVWGGHIGVTSRFFGGGVTSCFFGDGGGVSGGGVGGGVTSHFFGDRDGGGVGGCGVTSRFF